MGASVDMRQRNDRDHRLAMALLTKSRYMLSPHSPSAATAESAKLRESDVDAEQPLRRPPRMPSSQAMTPRKRRLAAALEALQATKRQRLASTEPSTSISTKSSSDRDTSSSSQPYRGIVRRSIISSGISGGHPGRPRSLQFALKDLSSADTRYLLQTLSNLPHDIARLNAVANNSSSSSSPESKVFGWHNSFVRPHQGLASTQDNASATTLVIWKACKTFESTDMRPLAQKVWSSTKTLSQQPLSKIRSWELLYTVSESVRVVKRVDSLYGRGEREMIWLECFLDRGDHFCIGRKQLSRFRDYQLTDGSSPSAAAAAIDVYECEGFLFRPHLTKLSQKEDREKGTPKLLLGCTLQCVSSIASRELTTEVLLRNLIDNLPQSTLQWEEAIVHDLLPHVRF